MMRFYTDRKYGVLQRWVDITQKSLVACRHELRMIRRSHGDKPVNLITYLNGKYTLSVLLGVEKWPI